MEIKKTRIINITIEHLDEAGCNNGNYPAWEGTLPDGTKTGGVTCRCMGGCSNTDRFEDVTYELGTMSGYLVEYPEN
jgi:hypothetical protein